MVDSPEEESLSIRFAVETSFCWGLKCCCGCFCGNRGWGLGGPIIGEMGGGGLLVEGMWGCIKSQRFSLFISLKIVFISGSNYWSKKCTKAFLVTTSTITTIYC